MAYTIGSDKGKEIAKNMTVGSTYKASDGSTWTKKADGSVSVTHQGVTTNNAYTPSSSGSSGNSGGSSGGSSSKYASTGGDMGTYGQNQMASGATWQEVLQTYYDRKNKAESTEGLGQYANDALQQEMWNYVVQAQQNEINKQVEEQANWEEEYWNQEQPTYEAQYDPAMLELMNQILNREDFSYDAQSDPLYQQYAAQYQQEGDRAMRETLANAAASAGGMNSYAITAAQQANNYYASQMANKIPELYQLAYNMYLQNKESDVQDLGILQSLDATQYNRYRDTMSDYYNDKNFAYNAYMDAVAQGNWQKNFDYNALIGDRNFNYGVSQDNQTQSNWETTYNDNKAQLELENSRYDDEIARSEAEKRREEARADAYAIIASGNMPPANVLEAAEMDEATAQALVAAAKADLASKSSGSGGSSGGSGGGGGNGGSGGDEEEEEEESTDVLDIAWKPSATPIDHPNYNDGTVAGLGIGMIDNDTLEMLIKLGAVGSDDDSSFHWTEGWSANNWQARLEQLKKIGYGFTH